MDGIEKQTTLMENMSYFWRKDKLTRTEIVNVDACSVPSL